MYLFIVIFVLIYFILMKDFFKENDTFGKALMSAILVAAITLLLSAVGYLMTAKIIYTYAPKAQTEYTFYKKLEPMTNSRMEKEGYLYFANGLGIYQTDNHKFYFDAQNQELQSDNNSPQWNTIYKRVDGLQNKFIEKFIGSNPRVSYVYKVESKNIISLEKEELK